MRKILLIILLGFSSIYIAGCLTVESKEYYFKLDKDKSGHGSIKYTNIMSENKDSISTTESDYRDLIDSYLKGEKLNEDLTGVKNLQKKLYEEDNQLCGIVTFDFNDITKLKFFKYKDSGPWCYYLAAFSMGLMGGTESYFSSNGTFGGENMPVIFWDNSQREFNFKTAVTAPDKSTVGLLEMWKQKGDN
jgi:hypothetical protein